MMRSRDAPSALRTTISDWRMAVRANISVATFAAAAMSSSHAANVTSTASPSSPEPTGAAYGTTRRVRRSDPSRDGSHLARVPARTHGSFEISKCMPSCLPKCPPQKTPSRFAEAISSRREPRWPQKAGTLPSWLSVKLMSNAEPKE